MPKARLLNAPPTPSFSQPPVAHISFLVLSLLHIFALVACCQIANGTANSKDTEPYETPTKSQSGLCGAESLRDLHVPSSKQPHCSHKARISFFPLKPAQKKHFLFHLPFPFPLLHCKLLSAYQLAAHAQQEMAQY